MMMMMMMIVMIYKQMIWVAHINAEVSTVQVKNELQLVSGKQILAYGYLLCAMRMKSYAPPPQLHGLYSSVPNTQRRTRVSSGFTPPRQNR
jgi:hypothetical protein